jgi:tRNA threonylcarbamoyl adenosine modification protein YeaZ
VLVLVVDAATPAVTAAVAAVDGGGVRLLAHRTTVDARGHGELLAPHVTAALAAAGARPGDLGAVVAGTGPGPYTGLRVGLVTAAAIAQACGIPAYGVCSLDALGAAVTGDVAAGGGRGAAAGRLLVATDARRREIYWAVYDGAGARVAGPAVDRPADVAARLRHLGVVAAAGEGAHRYARDLGVPVHDEPRYPPPAALAVLAADRIRAGAPGERLAPRYLRRPDAVAPGAPKPVSPR